MRARAIGAEAQADTVLQHARDAISLKSRSHSTVVPCLRLAADCIAKRSRIVLQIFSLSRSAARGVGCSTETGSDAGKVFLRASSSVFSRCLRSRLLRALAS